ncbi:serine/threonine protein kinase [Sphingomonas segetis]|jgi:serine/threonine protein kinase|uniref:serine/threonine protein kinase n=1 Tax=Sphingomonas segetis TaxID=1104779 RepID=UPI0012D32C8F|nr:serine/threonine-protein kinase [Sphingomonas segetis]
MTKAYSNKALPMGTVLREWRIEEVLGVGGFGIVYKARGVYFNELVAIKEYFPSSISERDSEDTVVPIDSDAEEVHALGLKKFVEEAKLLWNLSTPSRHPNIVSVRSLFEIHGTAYMVMDFEDGMSLSRMLKQGRRFNERSLWNILQPIAEGLERAHRVGVLHRDIKPPNILINEDNRPVLIDFGSARFEAAEATSTKVTFHTPPYAAIEQYVKTYPQGPWTDIYALGVVMYECVTGEKPPEVLERLHAGLGTPLAAGKWPGYGKRFLAAIDTAMTVKPDERPQTLSAWLAMFGKPAEATDDADDEATRFFASQVEAEEIMPVPPTPDVDPKAPVQTGVPADPKEAKFKRVGEETGASKKRSSDKKDAEPAAKEPEASEPADKKAKAAAVVPIADKAAVKGGEPATAKKKLNPVMLGAVAAGLVAVIGVGAFTMRGGGSPNEFTNAESIPNGVGDVAPALGAPTDAQAATDEAALANEAQNSAAPEAAEQEDSAQALQAERAKAAAAQAQLTAMKKAAAKAAAKAGPAAPSAATARNGKTVAAAEITATPDAGVSSSTLSQFNATVDDARAMAKRVMRSGSGQNVQLARNYDSYLKTLKASMRGIETEKEAQKLLKQANQTRAYIVFLQKQPSQ